MGFELSAENLRWLLAGILVFKYISGHILEILNLSRMTSVVPAGMNGWVDQKSYELSIDFTKAKSRQRFLTSTFSFLIALSALMSGFFGVVDAWIRQYTQDPFLITFYFFVVLFGISEIATTPFAALEKFNVDNRFHKTEKVSVWGFIFDKIKSWVITLFFGYISLLALVRIIGNPMTFPWFTAGLFVVAGYLFIKYFLNRILIPVFNPLREIEDKNIENAVLEYCQSVNFPVYKVKTMRALRKADKRAVYFTGFGKNRTVIFEASLLKEHPGEELITVLAHEVGHRVLGHIPMKMALTAIHTGLLWFVFSRMAIIPQFSQAMGGEIPSLHFSLFAFLMVYSPVTHLTGLFLNSVSRRNEFEADKFAARTTPVEFYEKALIRLYKTNPTNLTPHPAYVFVNYSHPPLARRIQALKSAA